MRTEMVTLNVVMLWVSYIRVSVTPLLGNWSMLLRKRTVEELELRTYN